MSEIVVSSGIIVNSFHNIDEAQRDAAEELQRWIGGAGVVLAQLQ